MSFIVVALCDVAMRRQMVGIGADAQRGGCWRSLIFVNGGTMKEPKVASKTKDGERDQAMMGEMIEDLKLRRKVVERSYGFIKK